MDVFLSAIVIALCLAPMALGVFTSIKILNIPDITTDGSYTLGGVITALLLSQNISFIFIIPTVIICGAICGVATAYIHTKLKIDSLLSGILVMTALYSINLSLLGRSNLPIMNTSNIFNAIDIYSNPLVNYVFVVGFCVSLIYFILSFIFKTDFGITMRATGNNNNMVRALGVNDNKMKILGLAISNALTAIAGFLMVQNQLYADVNMGVGVVITGLGSVLLADGIKTMFKFSAVSKQLFAVVIGVCLFQLVLAFTLSIGINPNLLKLTTSIFVLLIVFVTKIKR